MTVPDEHDDYFHVENPGSIDWQTSASDFDHDFDETLTALEFSGSWAFDGASLASQLVVAPLPTSTLATQCLTTIAGDESSLLQSTPGHDTGLYADFLLCYFYLSHPFLPIALQLPALNQGPFATASQAFQ